jgi:hypothetical protein
MAKKEICTNSVSIAYYSGFNGLEVKAIIRGKSNEIYAISNAWAHNKKYHRLRIYKNNKGEYIRLHGYICYLQDFIKI